MLRMSLKSMLAHRRRLIATAVAVILGVALITGTLVLTDTISRTFGGLYNTVYQGTDAVVRAKAAFTGIQNSGAQRPPVDASLVASLRTVNGVAADEGVIFGYTRLIGKNGQALGSNQPAGNYLLGISAYQANFTNQYDLYVLVKKAPGASASAARAAVKTITRDYPGTTVQDQAQFEAQATQFINQLLNLIYVLLLLTVIIALLGIGNTIALSIYERIREIGLFRAVGMTRRQLRSTIRLESVVIALQGTALGLLIGVLFGWAIVHALNLFGTGVVSIPYRTLAAVVILAAIGGVVTAIRPTRRAAKLNILRAIVTE